MNTKIENRFIALLASLKNTIDNAVGAALFLLENYKKRYPYVLLGEKKQCSSTSESTILLYRISGKRYIFESSAIELCNSQDLIGKFHPLDVRTISFIAGVEQIISVEEKLRQDKFELLKKTIFENSRY